NCIFGLPCGYRLYDAAHGIELSISQTANLPGTSRNTGEKPAVLTSGVRSRDASTKNRPHSLNLKRLRT
ncbi:MAG: hypothetical protein ABSF90_24370, partial [Syntrophobacteraceae bacterium]